MMPNDSNKLIVIGGATATGKTLLAIQLAQHFNTQILSADSRQCYHELNIGVAKPSLKELELVPHHFINSHFIEQEVTAGDYERYGLQVLDDIFTHNPMAILVGGTGLYIKALCEGLDDIPAVNETIKKETEVAYKANGLAWLQQELQAVDPDYFNAVDAENPMRLLRALIFYKSHGVSITTFQTQQKKKRNFEIEYYSIDIPRHKLYDRINDRVDKMMHNGLLLEVQSLAPYKQMKALQTVGYKELFAYIDGNYTLAQAVDKIKQHTRNYAKRQMTWFKNQGAYNLLSVQDILRKFGITNLENG